MKFPISVVLVLLSFLWSCKKKEAELVKPIIGYFSSDTIKIFTDNEGKVPAWNQLQQIVSKDSISGRFGGMFADYDSSGRLLAIYKTDSLTGMRDESRYLQFNYNARIASIYNYGIVPETSNGDGSITYTPTSFNFTYNASGLIAKLIWYITMTSADGSTDYTKARIEHDYFYDKQYNLDSSSSFLFYTTGYIEQEYVVPLIQLKYNQYTTEGRPQTLLRRSFDPDPLLEQIRYTYDNAGNRSRTELSSDSGNTWTVTAESTFDPKLTDASVFFSAIFQRLQGEGNPNYGSKDVDKTLLLQHVSYAVCNGAYQPLNKFAVSEVIADTSSKAVSYLKSGDILPCQGIQTTTLQRNRYLFR